MNTTVIKHGWTGAHPIRIVGLIAVIFLAAALGIVVGNALQGSDAPAVRQAATDTTSSSFSLDAMRHVQAARGDAGAALANVAPVQTDPRRHLWAPIDNGLVAPAQTDPRPHLRAPIDNVDETSSLTRPTPR